jgi:hypothetical protein
MNEGTPIARGQKIAKKLYHMDFMLVNPNDAQKTYLLHNSAPS